MSQQNQSETIACPGCGRKIAAQAQSCIMCGYQFEHNAPHSKKADTSLQKNSIQLRVQHLLYISILLFASGVLLLYFARREPEQWYSIAATLSLTVGGAGYMISRVWSLLKK